MIYGLILKVLLFLRPITGNTHRYVTEIQEGWEVTSCIEWGEIFREPVPPDV